MEIASGTSTTLAGEERLLSPSCLTSSPCSGRRGWARPASRSSWPTCSARRGEDPVAIGADALQVYEGLGALTGGGHARGAGHGSSTGWWASCPSTQKFDLGQYMPLAHAEIDAALAAGRRPIVVGGTGLYLRGGTREPVAAQGRGRAVVGGDAASDAADRADHGPRGSLRAHRPAHGGDRRRRGRGRGEGRPRPPRSPRARHSASTSCWPATSTRSSSAAATTRAASSPGCARWPG